MTRDFVLDANALIRYFKNEHGAAKVRELFLLADKGKAKLTMSVVNLAEVLYVAARGITVQQMRQWIQAIGLAVDFDSPTCADSLAAGEIRLHYNLGLADSFAAELALRKCASLVTSDPDFVKVGKQLKILALPKHSA